MSYNTTIILLAWIVIITIFLGFIILLRYLHHRERMALIKQGIHPDQPIRPRRVSRMLRAGLITMMVGITLTIGLYPIGFLIPETFTAPFRTGPWLLPGLIPFGVGLALTISYYLEHSHQPIVMDKEEEEQQQNISIIPIEEHFKHDRQEEV